MDSIDVYSKGKVDELIRDKVDKDRVDTIEGYVERNTNEVVDKALSFADYQSLMDKLTELEARIDSLEAVKTASNDAQALDITEEDGVVSIKRT